METLDILRELQELVEKAPAIPVTGKCLIDKDELLDYIQQINQSMPDDLKQAKWIKGDRQRILSEAQTEADHIVKDAENKIIGLINEHEITKKAYEKSAEIENNMQKRTKELKAAANSYIENKLAETEKCLEAILAELRSNRESLHTK